MSFSMLIGSIEKNPGQINLENYTLNLLGDSALLGVPKAQWALCKDKGKKKTFSYHFNKQMVLPCLLRRAFFWLTSSRLIAVGQEERGHFLLLRSLSEQLRIEG